jgi:hypothetical protein
MPGHHALLVDHRDLGFRFAKPSAPPLLRPCSAEPVTPSWGPWTSSGAPTHSPVSTEPHSPILFPHICHSG